MNRSSEISIAAGPGRLQQELRQNKPFANLQAEAFLNVVRTADVLQHALRQELKPYGITETQYNALRILRGAVDQGLTCSEIARRLISHDPDITRLLGRMEREGWVARARDDKDRRTVLTQITTGGLRKLDELDGLIVKSVDRLLAHVGKEELQTLVRLLENVRAGSQHG
ncbi:MAG TPA: MarR family transcriptional regulator [Acidobacteriaceae bacterium]|nr:MarR family transcriptional regulator [Acidobacteriaceae bacterium]